MKVMEMIKYLSNIDPEMEIMIPYVDKETFEEILDDFNGEIDEFFSGSFVNLQVKKNIIITKPRKIFKDDVISHENYHLFLIPSIDKEKWYYGS